ncbi:MAG: T9SS type A sorting domain-containing protein [Crocinitomicaceae bacterium]|nr:T9SS type A sorting domain-containing protein [Crocinitomicaceae bacterium]
MNYINTLLTTLSLLLLWQANAQVTPTSVYQCFVNDPVPAQTIDMNDDYKAGCVLFEGEVYDYQLNENKTVTASQKIDVEPNKFSAHDFTPGNGMTLVLCNDLKDVLSFTHEDLSNVEALKKFEFGIELPANVEARIQDFILNGDTTGNQINPYLEWQLNAEATFIHRATEFEKVIDGFYFQDYKRQIIQSNLPLSKWFPDSTTHHMRFRYAPEKLGVWDVHINVILEDGSSYSFCPFIINVTPNSEDDGFVKVAANQRVLERNDELFFPVGQNLPWPFDETSASGPSNGAYQDEPSGSYTHQLMEAQILELKDVGVDYFRLILNPASLDIEFEEVGNYTDRLNYAWEIDHIIEQAEELDMYIHFNMLLHYQLESPNAGGRLAWDWSDSTVAAFPAWDSLTLSHYAYKSTFGLSNMAPEAFFSDEGCKKYYKQRLRYLVSRYGYTPHIAMFELLSEASNAGRLSKIAYIDSTGVHYNDSISPYNVGSSFPLELAWWHDEMAKYIKNELGHTEHLISANYAQKPIGQDYTYAVPEIDVISWNQYNHGRLAIYQDYGHLIDSFSTHYNKPIFFSESGPLHEADCDSGVSYRKQVWMNAFTGIAGFNMWKHKIHSNYAYLGNVNAFIKNNSDIGDLFLGSWEAQYYNDVGNVGEAFQKEVNLIRGFPQGPITSEFTSVGVISNMTDNRYTNNTGSLSSYCYTEPTNTGHINKENLLFQDQAVFTNHLGSFVHDDEFFNTNGVSIEYDNSPFFNAVPGWPMEHPLSCVESSCAETVTAEIPFIQHASLGGNKSMIGDESFDWNRVVQSDLQREEAEGMEYSMRIFPNPAQDVINITCLDANITQFHVCDAKGRVIYSINRESTSQTVEVSNLASGIFVILGVDKSNTIMYQQRWVKQ